MTKAELEPYVKGRFNMNLYEFIKNKIEVESLYDYQVASILNISNTTFSKLRNDYGIKRVNGFSKSFESIYGKDALEAFRKIIESPDSSLSDVGRHFGFSREYARQVYKKIYGCSYAGAHKKKQKEREQKRFAQRMRESKQLLNLMKVRKKMKSMGFIFNITNRGRLLLILTNSYKLALKITYKPIRMNKKQYFRITNTKYTYVDIDFFICLCSNKEDDIYFIIPSNAMPKYTLLLSPHSTPGQSKYARFKEAWHLLN